MGLKLRISFVRIVKKKQPFAELLDVLMRVLNDYSPRMARNIHAFFS